MLTRLTTIVLICSNLLMVAKFTLPYLWYYGNYEYISVELCIHKDEPDHECNGYCQLQKMIQEQQDQHDTPLQSSDSQRQLILFAPVNFSFTVFVNKTYRAGESKTHFTDFKPVIPTPPPPAAA